MALCILYIYEFLEIHKVFYIWLIKHISLHNICSKLGDLKTRSLFFMTYFVTVEVYPWSSKIHV